MLRGKKRRVITIVGDSLAHQLYFTFSGLLSEAEMPVSQYLKQEFPEINLALRRSTLCK